MINRRILFSPTLKTLLKMMPQSKPLISIENVVVTATIDQRLDLKDITKKFPEVEWRPELFPGDEN